MNAMDELLKIMASYYNEVEAAKEEKELIRELQNSITIAQWKTKYKSSMSTKLLMHLDDILKSLDDTSHKKAMIVIVGSIEYTYNQRYKVLCPGEYWKFVKEALDTYYVYLASMIGKGKTINTLLANWKIVFHYHLTELERSRM